jgi:ATP-dependent DNA helicase PIF1
MLHKHAFEFLDRQLRDLCNPDMPFGGKVSALIQGVVQPGRSCPTSSHAHMAAQVVILAGDFKKVLPVVHRGSRAAIVAASVCTSFLWPSFNVMKLQRNMRVAAMEERGHDAADMLQFSEWLLRIGDGGTGPHLDVPQRIRSATRDENDLVLSIFGDVANDPSTRTIHNLTSKAILTPLNDTVDKVNKMIAGRFPGAEHVFRR